MAEHGHANKAIELFQALADAVPNSRSIMMVNIGTHSFSSAITSPRQLLSTGDQS
jgi:hypothetical protein